MLNIIQSLLTTVNLALMNNKMKKLLLLSALLIFACSSDDSDNNEDDNSNQTFLERYDGVVWERAIYDDGVEYISYVRFNNDDINWWTSTQHQGGVEFDCWNLEQTIDEISWTLISNSGNFFSCSVVYPEGDGGISNITVTNGGNTIEIESLSYSNFAQLEGLQISTSTGTRSQDEHPCD